MILYKYYHSNHSIQLHVTSISANILLTENNECDIIYITGDNEFTLYGDGSLIGTGNNWRNVYEYCLQDVECIAVDSSDWGAQEGIIASIPSRGFFTNELWKCTINDGSLPANWMDPDFDDSAWPQAVSRGVNGVWPWNDHTSEIGIYAHWIWTQSTDDTRVACRRCLPTSKFMY